MSDAARSPAELLDAALSALDRGRPREAAERLREAWRATRDPDLADGYALLLREHQAEALAGDDPKGRAEAWRARARERGGDPLELPVLLAEPWTSDCDELERLRRLAAWSPDPLLAEVLGRRLRIPASPPTLLDAEAIRRETIRLLDGQADPRQRATLSWLEDGPLRSDTRAEVRRALARLDQRRPAPLGPEGADRAARLARRVAPRRAFEQRCAELLAAVHADPDADAPRHVYADWLAAHGDPRGEFIGLQLARAGVDEPPSTREQALLDRHGARWAGDLHAVLGEAGRVFERGFLHAASIEVAKLDGELVDAPEWATLRILDGHLSDALARRARLDGLRELYGYLQVERFVALRADDRLASVHGYECSLREGFFGLDVPLGLRALLVRQALDDTLEALCGAPAIAGLEQLGLYYSSAHTVAADHRERRSPRHRFELLRGRLPEHVRTLRLIDDDTARASRPCGWVLSFARDELGLLARLRVDWTRPAHGRRGADAVAQLLELLDGIAAAGLGELTLGRFADPARELAWARLTEFADAAGCELVDG